MVNALTHSRTIIYRMKTCLLFLYQIYCLTVQCICFFTVPITIMNDSLVTKIFLTSSKRENDRSLFCFVFVLLPTCLPFRWDEVATASRALREYQLFIANTLICRKLSRVCGNSCLGVDVSLFSLKCLLQPVFFSELTSPDGSA